MKINWGAIKLLVIIGLAGFLFAFANQRNKQRNLTGLSIEFVDENPPLITIPAVNKLLIQNNDTVTSIPKDALDLKEMELRLNKHPMVREAQVFVSISGQLQATIEQRNPIARITGNASYYLDEEGETMPLSSVFSARVPLVSGNSENNFSELTPLILEIRKDTFMQQLVTGLHQKRNGEVLLRLRAHDFTVNFGKPNAILKKFQNFKAFYQKAQKDKKLDAYHMVNLQFGSQVVAVKN